MYGYAGPGSGSQMGSTLSGQPQGNLKVILDTTNPANYTVQHFDGSGSANGVPVEIGAPALTHIAISGGTAGTYNLVTLSEVPEPSSAALLGLAGLALLRRRRS